MSTIGVTRRCSILMAGLLSLHCAVNVGESGEGTDDSNLGGAAGASAGTGGQVWTPPASGGSSWATGGVSATGGTIGTGGTIVGTGGITATGGSGGCVGCGGGGGDQGYGGSAGYAGEWAGGAGGVEGTGAVTGTGGMPCGFPFPCATGGTAGTGGTPGTGGAIGTGGTGGGKPGYSPDPTNPAECPVGAPENPVGDCLGLPIYLSCKYSSGATVYSCVCDWYHWLCV